MPLGVGGTVGERTDFFSTRVWAPVEVERNYLVRTDLAWYEVGFGSGCFWPVFSFPLTLSLGDASEIIKPQSNIHARWLAG